MDEIKGQQSSEEVELKTKLQLEDKCPDQIRREFLKQYTAPVIVSISLLMSASTSAVAGSDGGPQEAPQFDKYGRPMPPGVRKPYF